MGQADGEIATPCSDVQKYGGDVRVPLTPLLHDTDTVLHEKLALWTGNQHLGVDVKRQRPEFLRAGNILYRLAMHPTCQAGMIRLLLCRTERKRRIKIQLWTADM
jgi:hypothetical protein